MKKFLAIGVLVVGLVLTSQPVMAAVSSNASSRVQMSCGSQYPCEFIRSHQEYEKCMNDGSFGEHQGLGDAWKCQEHPALRTWELYAHRI